MNEKTRRGGKWALRFMLFVLLFIIFLPPIQTTYFEKWGQNYDHSKSNNVSMCTEIAQNYHQSHIYIKGVYDCDNMACDIWNMLKKKGINSEIVLGNLELGGNCDPKYYNHSWILAEVAPGEWVAIECTAGDLRYDQKYYEGLRFRDPAEYWAFYE